MFCNPPYGRAIADWVRKGYEESRKPGTTVVMLIPSRTDTAYFHDWIFGKASEVRFLRGRLKFTDEDGNGEDAAPFPSAVIVWRSPESTDREAVTIMASNIVNTQQGTFSDDGVSQQAIIKTGVTTKDAAFVPNPVNLIPYRTFLEVPQPASDFVFRISEGRGGAPAFKLVAADGGLWKSQAVDNVKNYLVKALADVPEREKITIIA